MIKKLLIILSALVITGILFYSCQEPITQPDATTASNTQLYAFGSNPDVFDLYAGQDILVGKVYVWNDADYLYVKFDITNTDWCLEETHVAVATTLEGIPQKNGNPIPGQFPFKHENLDCAPDDVYAIPLSDIGTGDLCDTDIYIAAHAVVKDNTGTCELTGVVYGMERNTGDVYEIDVVGGTASLSFSSVVPPPTNISPNGLAYDGVNQRMYYCNYRSGASPRTLYFYDYNYATEYIAGPIGAENAAADFYNGKYYYISSYPGTDDLYKVMLNSDGTILSQSSVDISGNDHAWTFDGDIAIKEGILYGWGHCSIDNAYEFFTYDLGNGTFNVYNVTYKASLQLAFGSDGTLYGHRSADPGNFYVIDVTNGSVTGPITITPGKTYTDCASGMLCIPNEETAWGAGFDFPGKNWATYFTYTVTCNEEPPGDCTTETAWGGNSVGGGTSSWWYYFDTQNGSPQAIYAGQNLTDGTVTYDNVNDILTINLGSWELQNVDEPVKVEGYDVIPVSRPAAGLFDLYKGDQLTIQGDGSRYYAIHLDVQICPVSIIGP